MNKPFTRRQKQGVAAVIAFGLVIGVLAIVLGGNWVFPTLLAPSVLIDKRQLVREEIKNRHGHVTEVHWRRLTHREPAA